MSSSFKFYLKEIVTNFIGSGSYKCSDFGQNGFHIS